MGNIFITEIKINKLRHLENITIPLSTTERKHLILTGRNGCGKTTLLLAVRNFLYICFIKGEFHNLQRYQHTLNAINLSHSKTKEFHQIEIDPKPGKHQLVLQDEYGSIVSTTFEVLSEK